MKKFNLSLVAVLAMSTFAIAGGDIAPVEPVVEAPVVIEEDTSAFYIGIGYGASDIDLDIDGPIGYNGDSDTFNELMLQAGYKFNDYIAVEGRYWFGIDDNDWNMHLRPHGIKPRQDVTYDAWAIYVKPMYPVTESFDVYALLGYGAVSFDYTFGDTDFDDTDSFSWGLGVDYSFTENISVFADYTSMYDDDQDFYHTYEGATSNALIKSNVEVRIESWNFGVTYSF